MVDQELDTDTSLQSLRALCDQDKALDGDSLLELVQNVGPETSALLINAFLDELNSRYDLIIQAQVETDRKTMVNEAHSLKGAAGTFGAIEVEAAARALEKAGKAKDAALAIFIDGLDLAKTEAHESFAPLLAALKG